MTPETSIRSHDLMRRILFTTMIVIAAAVATTWSWNTIVPDLTGFAEFRFAEGLSVALLVLLFGALFEAGRQLVARGRGREQVRLAE